jgi:hypothetical protein
VVFPRQGSIAPTAAVAFSKRFRGLRGVFGPVGGVNLAAPAYSKILSYAEEG